MAAARRKRRRRASEGSSQPSASQKRRPRRLRRLDEALREWRYEPRASRRSTGALVALLLGGLALGLGVYGQWLRDEALGASPYAPYLLLVGVALVVGYLVLVRDATRALRVGDLGVGVEGSGSRIARTAWHEVSAISFADEALRVEAGARTLSLPLREQRAAARRILAEARERIPKKVDVHEEDRERIGEPGSSEGDLREIDPPQVTGSRCMSTDEPLTFEKDVRLCVKCGARYHKNGVPKRCVGCGAKLRS